MDLLDDLQSIFFKEVSKEEALRVWQDENNHQEVVILWDDLTESVIEDEERFDKGERFGIQLSKDQVISNKYHVYDELYKKLEEVKLHWTPEAVYAVSDVMEAINYIEAFGF